MLRRCVLTMIGAAALSAAALGGSTPASAEPWFGGYGGGYHGPYGGPPPWARAWGWRRHHHFGSWGRPWGGPPPYARPLPPSPHYGAPYGRGYGPY